MIVPFTKPQPSAPPPPPDSVYLAMADSAIKSQNAPYQSNFNSAKQEMHLNQQEQNLYQHHLNNLVGSGGVDNSDGSRSTVFQSVEEHNGRFYNVPTVWNGKIETKEWKDKSGKVWNIPNDVAIQNINRVGWDHFPSYSTPEEADSRYMKMHEYMEKDTATYLKRRKR